MPKHTAAQRMEIRSLVLDAYLQGVGPGDILRFLAEKKGYPLSRRQVGYNLAEAKKEMLANAKFDQDEQLGKAITRLEGLYRKSLNPKAPDLRGALAVQKEINVLLGLITHQHEHQGKMTFERWLRDAEESAEERPGTGENGDRDGAEPPDPIKTPEAGS